MKNGLARRISKNLDAIAAAGQTRFLSSPCGIDFSSNDFLGLAQDLRVKNAFIEGVKKTGAGSTGSRLLRGERDEFSEVERLFANFKQTENSLYFSSGYQANIGIFQTFAESGDIVFSDELNHASIIDGLRLSKAEKVIFKHRDADVLAKLLRETDCKGQKFLATESLFSMDGTISPLDKYTEICRETDTNLIVDEAHAVGIYGARGSGLIEQFGIGEEVFLSLNTAGKALGVSGAFVAGSNAAIEYLIQKCRSFIFSTAPPPAVATALKTSLEIIETEPDRRAKLLNLSQIFCDLLSENGFDAPEDKTQIIPVMIGESAKAVRISERLQKQNLDIRAIRPPTVAEGTSRLRVSLNINLTEEILQNFIQSLKAAIESETL